MTAHERANTSAVDTRHTTQVDDELVVAASKQLLNLAFERLGGTASDQRFVRCQNEPVTTTPLRGGHRRHFRKYLRAARLSPELQGVYRPALYTRPPIHLLLTCSMGGFNAPDVFDGRL